MKLFIIVHICLFSLTLSAQTPMFTTDVRPIGIDRFSLSNKGTKTLDIIDKSGRIVREWKFDEAVTGQCVANGKVYVTSSYGRGWLNCIDLETGNVTFKTETGMGACAPIVNSEGSRIYVFNQFKTTVSEIDARSGKVLRQVKLLREPVGGVISKDEKYLFVNNFLPAQRADTDDVAAEISVIGLTAFKVIRNIKLENGSNALRGICLSPDGQYVYIAHNLGRYQVPTTQLDQGWMNTSAISILKVPALSCEGTVLLDEPGRGAAGTWGVACDRQQIYVAHSGTHDISIIDRNKLHERLSSTPDNKKLSGDLHFLTDIRRRIPLIGNGPRNIWLSDGKLYVPTYFSDTLNIVDISTHLVSTIACNPKRTESAENTGEKIFNDASYCYQNWQSCNGCHPGDARVDGMNWDLMNDGIGNPKNCKSLLYAHYTPPAMITGIRASAEVAVRAGFKYIQFANPDPKLMLFVDAYLKSLRPLPSPFLEGGALSKEAVRGQQVFKDLRCDECHNGTYFTDMKMHRIGENIEADAGWDTPTLIEIWRTAPYLYNGRAATLKEVFSVYRHGINSKIPDREIEALTEYVNSL